MKILVDGDSCARKNAIVNIAKKRNIPVEIYCDVNHHIEDDYAVIHTVDQSRNSADLRIVNNVAKNDIVITNDIGLATIVLAREGIPMNNYGTVFTAHNINEHINRSYMLANARRKSRRNNVKVPKRRPVNKDSYKKSFNYQLKRAIAHA